MGAIFSRLERDRVLVRRGFTFLLDEIKVDNEDLVTAAYNGIAPVLVAIVYDS
jgi:hypothetical protein